MLNFACRQRPQRRLQHVDLVGRLVRHPFDLLERRLRFSTIGNGLLQLLALSLLEALELLVDDCQLFTCHNFAPELVFLFNLLHQRPGPLD